jgi:endo-1,4-beta-xylanase
MNAQAKQLLRHFLRPDPEVEARISEGITSNRMGFGEIKLVDANGLPVQRATIQLRLQQHEYQFGCNLFMLDQFPDAGRNAGYRERFKELFNLAVLPLYWSDLEPRDGALRFTADSEPIYRRPPIDQCLDYCTRNGITPKGHPLLWHMFWPDWLHGSQAQIRQRIARRFREIAERYADRIHIWDVANEAQTVNGSLELDGHVDLAFQLAGQYFPGSALTYNDDRTWWNLQGEYSPVYLLIRHLQARNLPVRALGFQYHMFDGLLGQADQFMHPRHLLRCLDQYAKLGIPLNLSEISIISRRDLGDGDEFQAQVVEHLYRLWFSHAATDGAIWWNLVDGTAAYAPLGTEEGENRLRAGLLNYDLSEKKAFTVLKRLITKEWSTQTSIAYEHGGSNVFRCFYGTYEATIDAPGGRCTRTLHLRKGQGGETVLKLDAGEPQKAAR